MVRKFKVPAAWAKRWLTPTVIGPYTIVPCINAKCPTERPTKADLFYRLMKNGEHISDHGDRAGAIYAANDGD